MADEVEKPLLTGQEQGGGQEGKVSYYDSGSQPMGQDLFGSQTILSQGQGSPKTIIKHRYLHYVS